jgi:heat shock protein HtpX
MVENLSARAGIPTPRIYVSPQAAPNAFATGRNPQHAAVAVTEGMLRNFPRDEIEGVLAHELAHVKHRDVLISTIAATLAGVISYVGYIFMFGGGSRDRENPFGAIGALLMIILAPLAAMLIQLAISRSREYAADAAGGELCGNPNKLASALARLGNANQRIPTDTPPAFNALYIAEPLSAGSFVAFQHAPADRKAHRGTAAAGDADAVRDWSQERFC